MNELKKNLITKQIYNIERALASFFKKAEEMDIITFEEWYILRDDINYNENEALLTWNKSGTGRYALGLDKDKNLAFGTTYTNANYTFNPKPVNAIIQSKANSLRKIILEFQDKDYKKLIEYIKEEIEEIKKIQIYINEFKIPTFSLSIKTKINE